MYRSPYAFAALSPFSREEDDDDENVNSPGNINLPLDLREARNELNKILYNADPLSDIDTSHPCEHYSILCETLIDKPCQFLEISGISKNEINIVSIRDNIGQEGIFQIEEINEIEGGIIIKLESFNNSLHLFKLKYPIYCCLLGLYLI